MPEPNAQPQLMQRLSLSTVGGVNSWLITSKEEPKPLLFWGLNYQCNRGQKMNLAVNCIWRMLPAVEVRY